MRRLQLLAYSTAMANYANWLQWTANGGWWLNADACVHFSSSLNSSPGKKKEREREKASSACLPLSMAICACTGCLSAAAVTKPCFCACLCDCEECVYVCLITPPLEAAAAAAALPQVLVEGLSLRSGATKVRC